MDLALLIVDKLNVAERAISEGGPAGRSYYNGQCDAYYEILKTEYSRDEIESLQASRKVVES